MTNTGTKAAAMFEAVCVNILRADRDLASESEATLVALDAAEARNPELATLLVGVPVTYSIGSDRYADEIAHITPSLHTITLASGKKYRWNAKYNTYKMGRSFWLSIGYARPYSDPSF